jgi:hypothetical protein
VDVRIKELSPTTAFYYQFRVSLARAGSEGQPKRFDLSNHRRVDFDLGSGGKPSRSFPTTVWFGFPMSVRWPQIASGLALLSLLHQTREN